VTEAAQEVQRSGYPSAYAVYEGDARALASALTGYSPASFWCHLPRPRAAPPPATRRAVGLRESLAPAFGPVEVRVGSGNRIELAASSPARGWAVASYLVAHAAQLGISTVGFRDREWSVESNRGWRHASDSATADSVVIG
jgi:hypothetical protein